jgi:hypothetical protein
MQNRNCNQHAGAIGAVWQAALAALVIAAALSPLRAAAQVNTTTVQGTVYRADGSPASGTVLLSWPSFTTPQNQAVAAGSLNAAIGANGFLSVSLTPNAGALPAGSYYTAVYHLSDGTVNPEYWVVPAAPTASIAAVRAELQPSTVAVQSVSQAYVQGAVSAVSSNFLPLGGGTLTGPLTLSGDPTGANQSATKHYADQLSAQNLPLSGGSLNGPLTVPNFYAKQLEGRFYADQWQTGTGNNGIFNSLAQCASLPYACHVLAPALYAQTEAQPFGGAFALFNGGVQSTGPLGSQPSSTVLDFRWGVPQWITNINDPQNSSHFAYGSRAYATASFVRNIMSSPPGTFAGTGENLNIQQNFWMGGRNFYNDKTNYNDFYTSISKYTTAQGGSDHILYDFCYANGDCIARSNMVQTWGGPGTAGDEGTHNARDTIVQADSVFTATVAGITISGDGSETVTTSGQANNGTQGEGRIVIDTTHACVGEPTGSGACAGGYISAIGTVGGNTTYTCAGCTLDTTYGLSTQTTLTSAVANTVTNTNNFPQSNVTLAVNSSSGFTVGGLACIFDYDYECEKITAVATRAVTIATDRLPHPIGAYVTTGGLAGYAVEMEADRVGPGNMRGLTAAYGSVTQTIRQAFPIMFNSSGQNIAVFNVINVLPGTSGGGYAGAAYQSMGSGGTCSVTLSGTAISTVTVSGGSGYSNTSQSGFATNPPQLVLSGGSPVTAGSVFVQTISGGALATGGIASAGNYGSTPTCTVLPQNNFDIYPAAKVWQVYNPASTATNGAVDGTLYTEPFSGNFQVADAVEEPMWMTQRIRNNATVLQKWFPSNGAISSGGNSITFGGDFSGNDQLFNIYNSSNPAVYEGYPAAQPYVSGYGQKLIPWLISTNGPSGGPVGGIFLETPPFGVTYPGGTPAGLSVGCGILGCSGWNAYYNMLAGKNSAGGVDVVGYNPSSQAWQWTAGATTSTGANSVCSLNLTGSTGGSLSVNCNGNTSKFDGAGNLTVPGTVHSQGALVGSSINGELIVDGVTYTTLNSAWTAAVNQALATGEDQTIRLGPMNYAVTATLTEPANGACVNLIGSAGATMNADSPQVATTLSVPASLGGDLLYLGNAAQAQGCTFSNLNILAQRNVTHAFEMQWFRGLLIDNVDINDTTAEGVLLGEETTTSGHQANFLLRNVTVSYSSAAFTPANRSAYGIHLEKTAIDSHLDDIIVRNALTAAVYNEGTGNTGYLIHGFGYPYTCATGPCVNNASSSAAANASYATSYVIYDTGGAGSTWTDTYADSPSVAGFYVGANGVSIRGGHIQWPDVTSFPAANLAYVASGVSNNLLIADVDCLEMANSVNWITYAGSSGNPPTYSSVHHLTGCGNYYQALEPANSTGFSSGGANINDPTGAVPRVWSTPVAAASSYPAYSAQMYSGYQGDAFQAHFSGVNPFFNVTYQGTIRTSGGIALSTVINTTSALTLTAANKNVIADATSGAQTLTLPSCYTPLPDKAAPTGLEFTIIKSDTSSNTVTLQTVSSQNINYNGAVAQTLAITTPGKRTLVCAPDYNWYAY